jgi:RimJ/RimL family protein N-acetyltransferase
MISVLASQVSPQLRALFDPTMPTALRCFAVLDGSAAGSILTDDPENPTRGAVWKSISGALYLGGAWDVDSLAQLVADLRQHGDVFIGYRHDDALANILPANGEDQGDVLEFTNRKRGEGAEVCARRIPDGCQVRRMDAALFEQCIDRDFRVAYYGSADKALEMGLGFCLMHGDDLLSEAFAYTLKLGMREISVLTHQDHQGRGYATLVAAHLILECESAGVQTYWNCDQPNQASARVARKLGYRSEKRYKVAAWLKAT